MVVQDIGTISDLARLCSTIIIISILIDDVVTQACLIMPIIIWNRDSIQPEAVIYNTQYKPILALFSEQRQGDSRLRTLKSFSELFNAHKVYSDYCDDMFQEVTNLFYRCCHGQKEPPSFLLDNTLKEAIITQCFVDDSRLSELLVCVAQSLPEYYDDHVTNNWLPPLLLILKDIIMMIPKEASTCFINVRGSNLRWKNQSNCNIDIISGILNALSEKLSLNMKRSTIIIATLPKSRIMNNHQIKHDANLNQIEPMFNCHKSIMNANTFELLIQFDLELEQKANESTLQQNNLKVTNGKDSSNPYVQNFQNPDSLGLKKTESLDCDQSSVISHETAVSHVLTDSEPERIARKILHKRNSDLPPPWREELYVSYFWEYSDIESLDASICDEPTGYCYPSHSLSQKFKHSHACISSGQRTSVNRRNEGTDTSSEDSHYSFRSS